MKLLCKFTEDCKKCSYKKGDSFLLLNENLSSEFLLLTIIDENDRLTFIDFENNIEVINGDVNTLWNRHRNSK